MRSLRFLPFVALLAATAIPLPAQDPLTANPPSAPADHTFGQLEVVATFAGPMPTGVTVSRTHRIFVNFPRWGDDVPFTVAELKNGRAVAYPNPEINAWQNTPESRADALGNATHFVSVQSVVVDPADRLWVLDTGAPMLKETVPSGPKLVCIDLKSNEVLKTILLPPETAGPHAYMNDVRFDLTVGQAATQDPSTAVNSLIPATTNNLPRVGPNGGIDRASAAPMGSGSEVRGFAYITDSSDKGPNGIVVVDLGSGKSWRRLNNHASTVPEQGFLAFAEGRPVYSTEPGQPPKPTLFGADGIAISRDGQRLFYCPLSGHRLYSVATAALRDRSMSDAQVEATVQLVTAKSPGDGMESDAEGNVYTGDYTSNSLVRIPTRPLAGSQSTGGGVTAGVQATLVHDGRLLWPDTMSLADDGFLYVTANQLNRQPTMHNGRDLRVKPYTLFRLRVDAKPVRLGS